MQKAVVYEHEEDAKSEAAEDGANNKESIEVAEHIVRPIIIPQGGEDCVLGHHDNVIDGHPTAGATLPHVEPAEDVDDPQHHVVDDLLPARHAEVRLSLDNPESHETPVSDNEDTKVQVEDRGKEGEGQGAGSDGKEVPQDLHHRPLIGHGHLIIAGISKDLLVRGNHPSERQERSGGRKT